jgi:hypothetical protein
MQQLAGPLGFLILASAYAPDRWELPTAAWRPLTVLARTSAPSPQLPAQAPREINVGDEVNETLTFHGDEKLFELTAPSDGTLVVRLSWDPNQGRLALDLADREFANFPENWSPIIGTLPVRAGEKYLVTVADGAPWDYDALFLPFVLKVGLSPFVLDAGSLAPPIGAVDTPVDNLTGVTGAVPFTGWSVDDVEVTGVAICRAAVPGEPVGADSRCAGAAQIFVGDGVFIDGARPDVQRVYSMYPRSQMAGWGFMLLTNTLPNQGNGAFVFSAYAHDLEGQAVLLGMRTMTCANAQATAPFGTIDTPGQGETISGAQYVNFGWALTQNPKYIPFDGSTLQVYVDGVAVGSPSYNHYRSDIATLFPGLANSNGAVGFKIIDTTTLSNGLHTIHWSIRDDAGQTSGVGSRFFRVQN